MRNIKEKINEFLKSFDVKTIENFGHIYKEIITYNRNKTVLEKSKTLYDDLTLQQQMRYKYIRHLPKPNTPLFSKNIDDYYIYEEIFEKIDYIATAILSGRTEFFNEFVSEYFGKNEEFNNACLSNDTLMEYLNKIQSIIDSDKTEPNSLQGKEKISYFKAIVKFLRENKKVRDSIIIYKQISDKVNLKCSSDITMISNPYFGAKILISNSMNGFIFTNIFGDKAKDLSDVPAVKLYMTIKEDKITDVMSDLGAFLLKNNITSFYKTRPHETNDMLTIRIYEIEKLGILINWLKNNKNIYFSNHPFMPVIDGVAMSFDEDGSYNVFIANTISSYIKNTKDNFSYESFVMFLKTDEYLSSLKTEEEKIFDRNLKIALTGEISLNEFSDEYVKVVNDYKLNKEIKNAFNNLEKNMMFNHEIYDDKVLLDIINKSLDEIKVKCNFKDMDNKSLLLSYYGKTEDDSGSLIDCIYGITLSKKYYVPAECYYLGKILEKWNNDGGRKKIEEGLKAFISISKSDGDYSNIPDEYANDYKYLLRKLQRKNVIDIDSLEFDLQRIILDASKQFGLERNSKDSKVYAIRKIYKKKKELQESD